MAALALSSTFLRCASLSPPPPRRIVDEARATASYSASIRVSLRGADLRARARALVAFQRPDRLRIEIPGPAGLRLVAVARAGRLTAAFPAERAVFGAEASAESLDSLLGVRLTPGEIMDILIGHPPVGLRSCEVRWGGALPRAVVAVLADGTRLAVDVVEAEANALLPASAFDEPPHEGYRLLEAGEARRLWSGK